jgi:hypothetical protein
MGWPFEFDEEIVVLPGGQRRVLRRCDHKPLGEPRCDRPACWVVEGYYDGRLQFRRFFCTKHLQNWQDALEGDERRGVLSWAWSYDIRRIASSKTLQRWMEIALKS